MSDLTYEYPAEVVMQRARETRAMIEESARLRAALEEIARKATQSVDTKFGGRLLLEIEVMARAALKSGAMSP